MSKKEPEARGSERGSDQEPGVVAQHSSSEVGGQSGQGQSELHNEPCHKRERWLEGRLSS